MHRYGMTDIANQEIGARRCARWSPQRVAMIEDQMRDSANYNYDGSTEWAALLRTLERESPDYRT